MESSTKAPSAPIEGAILVFFTCVAATCEVRLKQEALSEQEARMLKLVVVAGLLALVVHQYPDYAQSAKQAVALEMSHFFPPAR